MFAALVFASIPQAPPQPFTELLAAYPYGEQISLGVSPDGSRLYAAEGGAIDILDASAAPPNPMTSIDQIELPEASPLSILHFDNSPNPGRLLFIAGGTSGLWRAVVCPGVFANPPPVSPACVCTPPGCDRWKRELVDSADYPGFVRKRCLDVAVVEGNLAAGVPLLCAIFGARSDSVVGPSELRIYKILADNSVVPLAPQNTVSLPGSGQNPDAVATAIVADPADPDSVYVSLGTDWLWKVSLSTLGATQVPTPGILQGVPPEMMRDLAVVRTATRGTFIYATLDYGRILEYALQSGSKSAFDVGCRYLDRVGAVTDGGDRVLVAVGLQVRRGLWADSTWRPGHLWTGNCRGVGLGDRDVPPLSCPTNEVRFYARDPSPTAPSFTFLQSADKPGSWGSLWGSLELRRITTTLYRSYECTWAQGTVVREIPDPFSTPQVLGASTTYVGPGNSSADGVVSLRNPEFMHHGGENSGAVDPKRLYITPPPAKILPYAAFGGCDFNDPVVPEPTCFSAWGGGGAFTDEAQWLAADHVGEWFLPGTTTLVQTDADCDPLGTNECYEDSCHHQLKFWQPGRLPGSQVQVGFQLTYMTPGAANPPDFNALGIRWYQFASPTDQDVDPATNKTRHEDLKSSQVDPRTHGFLGLPASPYGVDSDTPALLHLIRPGSKRAYKVVRTAELLEATQATCPANPTIPLLGLGEPITVADFHEMPVHIEVLEDQVPPVDCSTFVPCIVNPIHSLLSTRTDTFEVLGPGSEEHWVTAVAAGFVVTGASDPCPWSAHSGEPNLVIYDVTETAPPAFQEPVLLRVGTGGGGDGEAFAVRGKLYPSSGKTFAFVADLSGKLLVFDVSWSELYPPASDPYLPQTPVLQPVATLLFPVDPYDGLRPNCMDVELDGNFAYCALGRGGVAIVDILDPKVPFIVEILETSGVAEGITFRTDENGKRQMVVGDIHSGLRLYGRPGE